MLTEVNVTHLALTDPTEGYLPAQISSSSRYEDTSVLFFGGGVRGYIGSGGARSVTLSWDATTTDPSM